MTKKLLVLDLDETLIYATEEPMLHLADFQFGCCHIYLRPHLADFIAGVREHFRLALWTAAGELYARQIAENIFPEDTLEFLWSRQHCTLVRDWSSGGYETRKRLKKVKKKGYPLESVIVVDDRAENYTQSYGNLVTVRPFVGDRADAELPLLLAYLLTLKDVPNVRTVEKRNWRLEVGAAVPKKKMPPLSTERRLALKMASAQRFSEAFSRAAAAGKVIRLTRPSGTRRRQNDRT